jgi:hypothetical protein
MLCLSIFQGESPLKRADDIPDVKETLFDELLSGIDGLGGFTFHKHHDSEESLKRSAEADCKVCVPLWNEARRICQKFGPGIDMVTYQRPGDQVTSFKELVESHQALWWTFMIVVVGEKTCWRIPPFRLIPGR